MEKQLLLFLVKNALFLRVIQSLILIVVIFIILKEVQTVETYDTNGVKNTSDLSKSSVSTQTGDDYELWGDIGYTLAISTDIGINNGVIVETKQTQTNETVVWV